MKRSCVLFSGGMDSFLAWKLFKRDAMLLFVDMGQPYLAKELAAALAVTRREASPQFMRVVASQIARDPMPSGIVLHRNALLILTAAMQYFNDITLGVLKDEINSDKAPEFFAAMQQALDISHRAQYWNNNTATTYNVDSPIRNFTKTQLVEMYLDKGHDPDTLLSTVSCYGAAYGHCGNCPSCFKRWVALTNNGLRQEFACNPAAWAQQNHIIDKALDGTYTAGRAAEVMHALRD